MRVQIQTKTGNPLDLSNMRGAKFFFPYRGDQILETSSYKIENSKTGLIDIDLSEFEINGLNDGDNQSFSAELIFDASTKQATFKNQLHVKTINEVKQLCNISHSN